MERERPALKRHFHAARVHRPGPCSLEVCGDVNARHPPKDVAEVWLQSRHHRPGNEVSRVRHDVLNGLLRIGFPSCLNGGWPLHFARCELSPAT